MAFVSGNGHCADWVYSWAGNGFWGGFKLEALGSMDIARGCRWDRQRQGRVF